MAATTYDEALHDFEVAMEEAQADNPEVEVDACDMVVAVAWDIEDDEVVSELCRTQLGWVPRELEGRLGRKDWIE